MTSKVTKSALDEVIEGYNETAKDLVRKWSQYASEVANNLDSGYDFDSASAALGNYVSLAIETGARLTWEAVDAMATLTGAPVGAQIVETQEFESPLEGAKLKLNGDLTNRSGDILEEAVCKIVPEQLARDEKKFKLRVNAAGYPAGVYRGTVLAWTPDDVQRAAVWVKLP